MEVTYTDVLIVGAGLSGLMAGSALQRQGRQATLLDRGRSLGGRLATRRIGPSRADHGAQFFTVFARTDNAFAALPNGTVEALMEDVPALTDVLLYHVVSGKVMSADVVMLDSADTVLGQPVAIMVDGDTVKVGDAQVIIIDPEASSGVTHVIDAVLTPQ